MRKFSSEHSRKIGEANRRRVVSEKTRKKIGSASRGRKHSEETRKKMSESRLGKKFSGKHKARISEALTGKRYSEDRKQKMSLALMGREISKKWRDNIGRGIRKYLSDHPEAGDRISGRVSGNQNPNWKGGISFEEYGQDWTDDLKDSVKKRDQYTCLMCGVHQDELNYKLHCHHIDYDKENCDPKNLISLCRSCHIKTNYHREEWLVYFKSYAKK